MVRFWMLDLFCSFNQFSKPQYVNGMDGGRKAEKNGLCVCADKISDVIFSWSQNKRRYRAHVEKEEAGK